ncbi:MAG: hypothetical protein ACRDPB_06385 [Nocardioidaceae bacterium]
MRFSRLSAGVAAGTLAVAVAAPGALASTRHDVRAAQAATDQFHGLQAAKAAGYTKLKDTQGISCIAMKGEGGMGVHFVKGALVGDPAVRLRHPEALVYRVNANGHKKLAALEYVVLRKDWRAANGQNAPRPRLYGHGFNFTPAGNRYGLPAFYSLHAWIWYDNPAGMFSMWNPRVHCPRPQ